MYLRYCASITGRRTGTFMCTTRTVVTSKSMNTAIRSRHIGVGLFRKVPYPSISYYSIFFSRALSTSTNMRTQQPQTKLQHEFLIDELRRRIQNGDMIHDAAQERASKRLSNLQKALIGYSNLSVIDYVQLQEAQAQAKLNTVEKEESQKEETKDEEVENTKEEEDLKIRVPRGLFLHGKVGTGKTHLMDMFHNTTSSIPPHKKRRVHFHSFLQNVHKRIHDLKQYDLKHHGRNFAVDTSVERNPIHRVGVQLANEVSLLCFDEFQVTDVADALILSQLFEVLFQRGTVVVATSNRHPEALYEGGLNRGYFLPFIDLLKRYCIVHDMNHEVDYREVTTLGSDNLFFGSTSSSKNNEKDYEDFLENFHCIATSTSQHVKIDAAFNRHLVVPKVYEYVDTRTSIGDEKNGEDENVCVKVARFHFSNLCNADLGSSDYRAVAQQFDAVIIDEIPVLTLKEHDQARRFITLIDELYEAKCAFACSSVAKDPKDLFVGSEREQDADLVRNDEDDETGGVELETGETLGIDVAQSNGITLGGLASVQELSFAFKRAASRLKEMTSQTWWESRVTLKKFHV